MWKLSEDELRLEGQLRDSVHAMRFFAAEQRVFGVISDDDVEYLKECTGAELSAHVSGFASLVGQIKGCETFVEKVEDLLDKHRARELFTVDQLSRQQWLWQQYRSSMRTIAA